METGKCKNSRCKLAHPFKCNDFYNGDCRRRDCRYLHPTKVTIFVDEPKHDNKKGVMDQGRVNGQYLGTQQGHNWQQNQYGSGFFFPTTKSPENR